MSVFATITRVLLLAVVAAAVWIVSEWANGHDRRVAAQALDARASALTAATLETLSPLACLAVNAGTAVESACEQAVFASPQSVAASVSYVGAQLSFLAEATDFSNRLDASYRPKLAGLRKILMKDRFGFVAHVLAARDGCTAEHCAAFSLFDDASMLQANLNARAYDDTVLRYAAFWPVKPGEGSGASAPVASNAPPMPPLGSLATSAPTATGSKIDFPSAASIPPVSIMNPEPGLPPSVTAAETAEKTKSAPVTPLPPRRPAQAASSPARSPTAASASAASTVSSAHASP